MRLVAAVLCIAIPSTALAQEQIVEEPLCPDCEIELEYLCTLGDENGSGALRSIPSIGTVDNQGRLVILQPNTRDLAAVFERDCDFVQRIGREGEGPNEYLSLKFVGSSGEHLILWDRGTGRMTWLSPELEEIRTRLMEGRVHDVLELADGRLIANMTMRQEPTSGYALHLIESDGSILHSFDSHPILYGDQTSFRRHLFPATAGGFWAVNAYSRYSLTEYGADATQLQDYSRPSYKPYGLPTYGAKDTDTPPHWWVRGGWSEGDTLWLVSRVPDERWREGVRDTEVSESDQEEGNSFPLKDMTKAYDDIVEAIDLASGQMIARHVEDFPNIHVVLGEGLVGRYQRDDLGWFHLRIYRTNLNRR